uniref:Uncharacterized protein n=1 Tax=Wuchereria bancrofti TaxID=6293 RepID=A0A1I8EUZ0_WUCBA
MLSCISVYAVFSVPFHSLAPLQTTSLLSAYQNGVIEGQWRERYVNYEKQIKALSANLHFADREIRRLAGLEMSESMITSRKRKSPYADDAVVMNYSSASTSASKGYEKFSHANNLWTEDTGLSKRPASSQNAHMQNKLPINEGNGMMICQPSSLKPRTFLGASAMQGPSDEPTTGADVGQLSESFHDSDSFNSDEEDSEEERLYNEKDLLLHVQHIGGKIAAETAVAKGTNFNARQSAGINNVNLHEVENRVICTLVIHMNLFSYLELTFYLFYNSFIINYFRLFFFFF